MKTIAIVPGAIALAIANCLAIAAPADEASNIYAFEGWTFDVVRRVLRDPKNIIISLSEGEFSLLRVLVERPQRVLTRDQLLEYARGPDSDAFDRADQSRLARRHRQGRRGSVARRGGTLNS